MGAVGRTRQSHPTLLCIGPEKTGTAWLYRSFESHPDVFLPMNKEVRYWNEGNLIPTHSLGRLLFSRHWHYVSLRRDLRRLAWQLMRPDAMARIRGEQFRWRARYVLGARSFAWYQSLFVTSKPVSVDIGPLYYHLPEARVREIARCLPGAKILILVREPIARAWSKARMNLLKHGRRAPSELDIAQFTAWAEEVHTQWVPYSDTIALWRRHFEHVHVAVYDDLLEDPLAYYRSICAFLGVEPAAAGDLARPANRGIALDMPPRCLEVLKAHYLDEVERLAREHGRPGWVARYR